MISDALKIGFDLPFSTRLYTARADDPFLVHIEAAQNLSETELRQMQAHVQVFVEAAMYGMGAGRNTEPRMAPSFSVAELFTIKDGYPNARSATYEALGLSIDLSYIPVLFHKLYCLAQYFIPLASVTVFIPAPGLPNRPIGITRADHSDLPALYSRLPFRLDTDLDSYSQSLAFTANFGEDVDEITANIVRDALYTWDAQSLQGGFISPTNNLDRDSYFIHPRDDILVFDGTIEWGVDKFEIDPRAINSLVNFFVALSNGRASVTDLTIE